MSALLGCHLQLERQLPMHCTAARLCMTGLVTHSSGGHRGEDHQRDFTDECPLQQAAKGKHRQASEGTPVGATPVGARPSQQVLALMNSGASPLSLFHNYSGACITGNRQTAWLSCPPTLSRWLSGKLEVNNQ